MKVLDHGIVHLVDHMGSDLSIVRNARVSYDAEWRTGEDAGKDEILLQLGVPRELARGVLPVNTYSHMFASVDLHNLMHFLKLRLHPHAQYEIRVYAEAILALITPIAPVAVAAFKEHYL